MNVLGLMSGTSMDGVDAAVLMTDGEAIDGFGPRLARPYGEDERAVLRRALAAARDLTDRDARPGVLSEAEAIVTDAHAQAVARLRRDHPDLAIDLIGFHGQTVFHAPERRLTVQIGDGAALARRLGVPVVFDLRAADVAAGGEGAPLVPVYHRALVAHAGLAGSVVVVNIGGVANLTRIGADGGLLAGDTGPGNALIDDFVRGAHRRRHGPRRGAGRPRPGRCRGARPPHGQPLVRCAHAEVARPQRLFGRAGGAALRCGRRGDARRLHFWHHP